MQNWSLDLENPQTTRSHSLLGCLFSSQTASTSNRNLSLLRQNWLPFLDAADETLARMTQEWGQLDEAFPADTSQLSIHCQELAEFCAR